MRDGESREHGIALCSKTEITNSDSMYYLDFETTLPTHDPRNIPASVHYGLLCGDIAHDGVTYTCATTHFTWTENGLIPSPQQIQSLERLNAFATDSKPHLLCGDFNIPRHQNSLYDSLVGQYKDNIPPHYTSSLDKTFHRLGQNPEKDFMFTSLMVDYVFTKPPYKASDVRLEFGLSDHAAIVATISKE
jgi:endonuclease/exonuclease/phosphatase family metal-dependent hydrolase